MVSKAKAEELLGDEPASDEAPKAAPKKRKPKASDDDEPGVGHNGGPAIEVEGKRLMAFVERIETSEEDRKACADDIKDIYAEAKGVGYDVKVIKRIVKERKQDKDKRREEDEIFHLYCNAIGMSF